MTCQKVVIICKIDDVNKLHNRTRASSNDIAGKNIIIFNNSQAKFLSRNTKHMNGRVHLEGTRCFYNKKISLSTCTYRNIMKYANNYMIKNNNKFYVGPAYTYGKKITDFQTVVTGTIERDELDDPIKCAVRELKEEIGFDVNNIELLNTSINGDLKVFTLIANL